MPSGIGNMEVSQLDNIHAYQQVYGRGYIADKNTDVGYEKAVGQFYGYCDYVNQLLAVNAIHQFSFNGDKV